MARRRRFGRQTPYQRDAEKMLLQVGLDVRHLFYLTMPFPHSAVALHEAIYTPENREKGAAMHAECNRFGISKNTQPSPNIIVEMPDPVPKRLRMYSHFLVKVGFWNDTSFERLYWPVADDRKDLIGVYRELGFMQTEMHAWLRDYTIRRYRAELATQQVVQEVNMVQGNCSSWTELLAVWPTLGPWMPADKVGNRKKKLGWKQFPLSLLSSEWHDEVQSGMYTPNTLKKKFRPELHATELVRPSKLAASSEMLSKALLMKDVVAQNETQFKYAKSFAAFGLQETTGNISQLF